MEHGGDELPQAYRYSKVDEPTDDGSRKSMRKEAPHPTGVLGPVRLGKEPRHHSEDPQVSERRVREQGPRR